MHRIHVHHIVKNMLKPQTTFILLFVWNWPNISILGPTNYFDFDLFWPTKEYLNVILLTTLKLLYFLKQRFFSLNVHTFNWRGPTIAIYLIYFWKVMSAMFLSTNLWMPFLSSIIWKTKLHAHCPYPIYPNIRLALVIGHLF